MLLMHQSGLSNEPPPGCRQLVIQLLDLWVRLNCCCLGPNFKWKTLSILGYLQKINPAASTALLPSASICTLTCSECCATCQTRSTSNSEFIRGYALRSFAVLTKE